MGAFRFPIECPNCAREFGGRLRSEEGYLLKAYVAYGQVELAEQCPQHDTGTWAFAQTPAWKATEQKLGQRYWSGDEDEA